MAGNGVVNPETLGRRMSRQRMLMIRNGGRARLALGQVPGAVLAPRELQPLSLVRSRCAPAPVASLCTPGHMHGEPAGASSCQAQTCLS